MHLPFYTMSQRLDDDVDLFFGYDVGKVFPFVVDVEGHVVVTSG
jgi:hypothetical protein